MAQPIKYNTGAVTSGCCIRRGRYDIGINTNYAYGPTASTGFWAGYPPGTPIPSGGFISYQNKPSQGPSIYNIPDVNDLVYFGTQLNLPGSLLTPEEVIYECNKSTTLDIALVNIDYPEIPLTNNIVTIDAGYTASYPWTNLEWNNIIYGGAGASLTGNTTFVSGTTLKNYSDSYLNMPAANENAMALIVPFGNQLNAFTINVMVNVTNGNGFDTRQNVVGQQYSTAINNSPQTDCNFLIRGNGSNGFQGLVRSNGTDYIVNFGGIITGQWKMLTLTYDGTNLTAFNNGNQVGQTVIGVPLFTLDNGLQTIIGGTTNAYANLGNQSFYFDGKINVVNIYDRALDNGEITGLYNAYRTPRGF